MASLYFDSRELFHFLLDNNNGHFEAYDKGDEYAIEIEAGENNQVLYDFLKLFNEGVDRCNVDYEMINIERLIITTFEERKEFMSEEEAEALNEKLAEYETNTTTLKAAQKSLDIQLKTLGVEHPDVAVTYFQIGCCHQELKSYEQAIQALSKSYKYLRKGGIAFYIAECMEKINNHYEAMNYYIQSAEIREADPDVGPEDNSTKVAIKNAIRLANELGKLDELPDWMTKIG